MPRKIVVIAGAGTSVDFGLPTGERILSELQSYEPDDFSNQDYDEDGPGFVETLEDFDLFMNQVGGGIHNQFPSFLTAVKGTSVPSIDLLAGHRSEFTELGKLWSVRCLFRNLWEAEQRCIQPRYSDQGKQVSNWLAGLCRVYYQGVTRMKDLSPDDFTIVTFNYDRLIETGINSLLEHSFPGIARAGMVPKVVHVHGAFDNLPQHIDAGEVARQAKNIRFVHETELVAMQLSELQMARIDIREADAIYCVGFALHAANCALLGLNGHGEKIRALNFDGRAGFDIAASTLDIRGEHIVSKMTVGEAVADDFFLR